MTMITQGTGLLRRYGDSTRAVLVDSFPELAKKQGKYTLSILYSGINSSSKTEPVGHWDVRENRHQFLVSFAEKAGFDPMLFDNWKNKYPKIRAKGVMLTLTLIADWPYYSFLTLGCKVVG